MTQVAEGIGAEQALQSGFRAGLCFQLGDGGFTDFKQPIPPLRFLKRLQPVSEKKTSVFGAEGFEEICEFIPFLGFLEGLTLGLDGLWSKGLLQGRRRLNGE